MAKFVVYFALPMVIIGVLYALMARILIQTTKHMPGEAGKSGQAHKQMEARKKVAKVTSAYIYRIVFTDRWRRSRRWQR